jgi:hypothetical protein
VLTTVVIFVSGIILMLGGPANRDQMLTVHKASFIVWLVFTALHVLGHLPHVPASLRAARDTRAEVLGTSSRGATGSAGRWIALAGALLFGLVLALVLTATHRRRANSMGRVRGSGVEGSRDEGQRTAAHARGGDRGGGRLRSVHGDQAARGGDRVVHRL